MLSGLCKIGNRAKKTAEESLDGVLRSYTILWHILHYLIQCNANPLSVAFDKSLIAERSCDSDLCYLNLGLCESNITNIHARTPAMAFTAESTTIGISKPALKRSFALSTRLSTASGIFINKNNAFPIARTLAALPPSDMNRLMTNSTNHKNKTPCT